MRPGILPPAITRLLFFIPWFDSFHKTLNGSMMAVELVLLLLDNKRLGKIRTPYPVALVLFALLHMTMNYAVRWAWWQEAMNAFSQRPL